MTFPTVIRIFFAIDLPTAAKEELGRFIGTLKKSAKTHGIRWTKPDNLHITLQFLAEVESEHLPLLMKNVRAELAGVTKHLQLTLGHVQLFPSPFRPRVIVLEIQPQAALAELSAHIGKGITRANYAVESRPFRAHLTLGRIKQPQEVNLNFLAEHKSSPIVDALQIEEIALFRSEPQPDGSKYTAIEVISLSPFVPDKAVSSLE